VNNDSSEMTRKLSLRERIGIYLELIDTHCKLHNLVSNKKKKINYNNTFFIFIFKYKKLK